MQTAFLDLDDPRWGAFLRRTPHDVYHRPAYVRLAARHAGGTATAFYAQADGTGDAPAFLVPLVLRPLPEMPDAPGDWRDANWRDAVSPYGYPAPLATPGSDAAQHADFWNAFFDHARARQVVSGFLRLHPLLESPALPNDDPRAACVRHGRTVHLDLQRPEKEYRSTLRRDHRRDIRQLQRDGFHAALDEWTSYDDFRRIYRATMERVGAAETYFFSARYFDAFKNDLDGAAHLCTVHAPSGAVAAAGLFPEADGLVQFHLSGTAAAYRAHSPSKLMLDAVRRWGAAQGHRRLHLGGGVGSSEDSLFDFKAGFSEQRAVFHTARLVFAPDRYETLTQQHGDAPEGDAGAPHEGFFPAYRRPPS